MTRKFRPGMGDPARVPSADTQPAANDREKEKGEFNFRGLSSLGEVQALLQKMADSGTRLVSDGGRVYSAGDQLSHLDRLVGHIVNSGNADPDFDHRTVNLDVIAARHLGITNANGLRSTILRILQGATFSEIQAFQEGGTEELPADTIRE